IGTKSLHIVSGHEGDSTNVKIARTRALNFERRVGGIRIGAKAERKPLVIAGQREGGCLPAARIASPSQGDTDRSPGSAAKKNAASVLFAANQRESPLTDSVRRCTIEQDLGAVFADEGFVDIHHYNFVRPHRMPLMQLLAHWILTLRAGRLRVCGCD